MTISFLHPLFFLLLVLVPALWFLPRRARDWRHAAIRSLVLALCVLALARPVTLTEGGEPYHVLVLDRSGSVPAEQRQQAEQAVAAMLAELPAEARLNLRRLGADTVEASVPGFVEL